MAIQMPRFNSLDLGKVQRDVESIKGQRLQNQANALSIEGARQTARRRKVAMEIRAEHEALPARIQALESRGLFGEADAARDKYIKTQSAALKMMESAAPFINEENWHQLRSGWIQSGAIDPSFMPSDYSATWMKKQIDEHKGKLSKIERTFKDPNTGKTMRQTVSSVEGDIQYGKPYEVDVGKTDFDRYKQAALSTGESAIIAKGIATYYGGEYNPDTGRFLFSNKGVDQQEIASWRQLAEQLFQEQKAQGNAAYTPGKAIADAGRRLGKNIADPSLVPEGDTMSNPLAIPRPGNVQAR